MNYHIILLLSAVCLGVLTAEDPPKADANAAQNITAITNNTAVPQNNTQTTPVVHATVNTLNSALCTKCKCSGPNLILDCSNLNLTKWFNEDELSTLQYGDVKFEKILLNDNELETVEKFPEMSVKRVELQGNKISKIISAAFYDLQSLEYLDLSHNQLQTKVLTPDVFKGKYSPANYEPLKSLRYLNLGSNLIHSLDPDLFEHFPNLENLTLSSNPFRVIDSLTETAIASIDTLKVLEMSYMQLSVLPNYIFHTPRDLEILNLTGNFFETLPEAITHAVNLKKLILDENLFAEFSGENVFPLLNKLEVLHMCYCPNLVTIGKGGFSKLENLKNLYLTNNVKLSHIHPNAMCRPRKNAITFDFPPLENLYLHNNNLTILDKSLFARWDLIKIIDLRFNPWKCDCDNDYIIHDLFKQIIDVTPTLVADVNCTTPVAWKGVPIKQIYEKKTTLRCEDIYGNHPENDGSILMGMLIGLLIGIPLAFAMLFVYRRGCFGLIRRPDSVSYNRAFYSQTNQDDYHI